MAVVFKIISGDNTIEVYQPDEENNISIFIGDEMDPQNWNNIEISTEEAVELTSFLKRWLNR